MGYFTTVFYDLTHQLPAISLSWAYSVMALQVFAHECGHLVTAKFFGIQDARFTFEIKKFFRIPVPCAAVFTNPAEMALLPSWKKRIIVSAGVAVDLLVLFMILQIPRIDGVSLLAWNSILVASWLRLIVTPLNIIPLAKIKNDGWRFFNPNSPD